MDDVVLQVRDLHTHFSSREGIVKAVNGVNLTLRRGKVLGVVGESGSGKSVTALSILRLVPYPGKILEGEIIFNGRDILKMDGEALRNVRGREVSMVFQDPMSGLNPVIPIGSQVAELLQAHLPMSKQEAQKRTRGVLAQVGLPNPDKIAESYPFQLSGGMSQRVMIGIATALNPSVLIADEPTSALDVTVQAQILQQLRVMRQQNGTSVLLITHDMGVVAQMCDEVAVMYAGSVVEYGEVRDIFKKPTHPYTWALLQTLPRIDDYDRQLQVIPGSTPDPINLPDECAFIPRCNKARTQCRTSPRPMLTQVGDNHFAACYNPVVHDW